MVFGGINQSYNRLNSIERLDMKMPKAQMAWELMSFSVTVLPEIQNSRMVQVNYDEICIFAKGGYCYYFDVEQNMVSQGMYRPDMRYDSVNMPALLSEAGIVVTGCSATNRVVEFKYNRPFKRVCEL